jgi:hypothetical protein
VNAEPPSPTRSPAARPIDGAARRLQGTAVLGILVLAGAGLARLESGGGDRLVHIQFAGEGSNAIHLAAAISRQDRSWPGVVRLRTVLTRVPVEVDFETSRLTFADGSAAAIPDVETILAIDRAGRIAEHPAGWKIEFAPRVLWIVNVSLQPSSHGGPAFGFGDVRRAIEDLTPELRGFWED